jgi:ribosomal protein S18 acetylase RimI-like enzyme
MQVRIRETSRRKQHRLGRQRCAFKQMIGLSLLTPNDWERWKMCRLRALAEDPRSFGSRLEDWQDADPERWRQRLGLPGSINVIASLQCVPAGIVSGVLSEDNQTAELISMWVAPEARGSGVARALVEVVLGWARDNQLRELQLDVFEENARAIAFYTKMGFVDCGPSIEVGERTMIKRV